jgi:Rhodopirellula transposase DDE domain
MQGVVFSDYLTVKTLMEQTSTRTGLRVVVRLNLTQYATGIKINKQAIDEKQISYHPIIPELNYRIYP